VGQGTFIIHETVNAEKSVDKIVDNVADGRILQRRVLIDW
jgi:hypothetical protein